MGQKADRREQIAVPAGRVLQRGVHQREALERGSLLGAGRIARAPWEPRSGGPSRPGGGPSRPGLGFRDRTVGGGSVWDPGRPDLDDQTMNTFEISDN